MLVPVARRPFGIVPLQRRRVILPLVAEQLPEFCNARRILNQAVPVIVRDFVTEMSEQRAIRFVHFPPAALALGIIRLGQIDRNHPAVVAGYDRISCRRALRAEEIEGETLSRVIDPGLVREPQLEKRIE